MTTGFEELWQKELLEGTDTLSEDAFTKSYITFRRNKLDEIRRRVIQPLFRKVFKFDSLTQNRFDDLQIIELETRLVVEGSKEEFGLDFGQTNEETNEWIDLARSYSKVSEPENGDFLRKSRQAQFEEKIAGYKDLGLGYKDWQFCNGKKRRKARVKAARKVVSGNA